MPDSASGVSKQRCYTERLGESVSDAEDPAQQAHVLAEDQNGWIRVHGIGHGCVEGFGHGDGLRALNFCGGRGGSGRAGRCCADVAVRL